MSEQEATTALPDVFDEQWNAGPTIHPEAEEWLRHGYVELRGHDFSVVGYWDNSMTEASAAKARARAQLAAVAPEMAAYIQKHANRGDEEAQALIAKAREETP